MNRLLCTLLSLFAVLASLHAAPTETHAPSSGATLNSLTAVAIIFSEAVVGVKPDDLLINGIGAAAVSGSGTTYTFTFTQPEPGQIYVDFDPENEITNTAGEPFTSTGFWTYTLTDTLPPTVTSSSPVAGSTLNALTQAEVVFSESVQGVDAADLLINGVPAVSVTGSDAGTYVFSFAQPANGSVTFSWNPQHGITDLASNAFSGAQWSISLNAAAASPNVIISEFLANNVSFTGKATMIDEDGDFSSWVEIQNKGAAAVHLLGWSLTNDEANRGQWVFPSVTLNAGAYLVVWASGKDRKAVTGSNKMHTNFTLGTGGDFLALYPPAMPRSTAATSFAPSYPLQRGDVSYGFDANEALRYFATPTFGTANGSSTINAIASPVNFSVKAGYFETPFQLVLSSPNVGSTIRYTTDGSIPTAANGVVYTSAIPISTTTIIRVAAFASNLLSSAPQTQSYLFSSAVLQQSASPAGFPITFPGGQPNNTWTASPNTIENGSRNYFQMDQASVNNPTLYPDGPGTAGTQRTNKQRILAGLKNIPTVSVVAPIPDLFSQATGIYSHPTSRGASWERKASVELIYGDGSQENFQADCGLQIQGGSSRSQSKSFKHSFRLSFKDDYGPTKYDAPLFPDSSVSSFDTFVLDGGSNFWSIYAGTSGAPDQRQRAQGLRDAFTSDLLNEMGWPSFHSRFANIFINGLYWGVDYLHERPDEKWAADYYGGEPEEYNIYRATSANFEVVAGDKTYTDWKAMMATYIWPVCNTSEAIVGTMTNANYLALQQVLDVTAFADYMICNLYVNNDDWPHHNWYVSKRNTSDGRFRFTIWDAEHTLKSATMLDRFDEYNSADGTKGGPGVIWGALRTNAEFRLLVADRLQKHFFNGGPLYVNPAATAYDAAQPKNNRPAELYMRRVREVSDAIAGEYAKWGGYTAFWPQSGGATYTRNGQWMTELNNLLGLQTNSGYTNNYFPRRSGLVLTAFRARSLFPATGFNAPNFSQFGGRISTGSNVAVSVPAGSTAGSTIYYTLDGSDPRVFGSGLPATSANGGSAVALSNGSVYLSTAGTITLKARALYGSTWSGLTEATFVVGSPAVSLRITELMYSPSPGGSSGSNYEYLELHNYGTQPLNIGGYYFDGINFAFPPNFLINTGARLILANNGNESAWRGRYPNVAVSGWYGGNLSNSGERVALFDSTGRVITSVTYGMIAPWATTPLGGGPSLELIDLLGDLNDPANWRASSTGGTPGLTAPATVIPDVEISEVLTKNSSYPINGVLADWVELHNTTSAAVNIGGWKLTSSSVTYVIPAGTSIAANAYLVILCTKVDPANGTLFTGYKVSGAAAGESLQLFDNRTPAIRKDGVSWGQQIEDLSIAKIDGAWQLAIPTPHAPTPTAHPLAPPSSLVLNEWLIHPSVGSPWIELFNAHPSLPAATQGLYAQSPSQLARFNSLSFLPPSGFLQVFTDSLPGANHVDLPLPATATTLTLLGASGAPLNIAAVAALSLDVSQGRLPDGAATSSTTFTSSTPAAPNFQTTWAGPIWNEVLVNDTASSGGWVELYNPSLSAWDVSGLKVGIANSAGNAWTIPLGTQIPAHGYLALECNALAPASTSAGANLNTGLALNSSSGGIFLFNASGQVLQQVQWGFQIPDRSIGLAANTWHLLASPTRGAENSSPATLGLPNNLSINEWLALRTTGDDWFELYNRDALPVSLSGLYLTDDPSVTGVAKFQIAPLSYIAGQGWVKYDADEELLKGNHHLNFKLSDAGEYLQISANDGNFTPLDAVSFGQQTLDFSQGRILDGGTVQASLKPTPGTKNVLLPAPTIASQPVSVTAPYGSSPTLIVSANGSGPLTFQWRFNDTALPGATSSSLLLTNITSAQDGAYTCAISNSAGSVVSNVARVTVQANFNQWSASYALGSSAGANDDPDHDGLSNLQEFFHNLNPTLANTASDLATLPKVGWEAATQNSPAYLTLTFRRNSRATALTLQLQSNSALTNPWANISPDIVENLNTDAATDNPIVRWKVAVPTGQATRFLRLQLSTD